MKIRHPLKSWKQEDSLPTITRIFSLGRFLGISSYGCNLFFLWTVIVFCLLLAIEFVSIWKFIRLLTGVAVNTIGNRLHLTSTHLMGSEDEFEDVACSPRRFTLDLKTPKSAVYSSTAGTSTQPESSTSKHDKGGLIGRLSGSIFYGNALISLVFSIKFVASWKNLSCYWITVDSVRGLNLPLDVRIRRKIVVVSVFIAICAWVEHILSMISATGLDIPITHWFQQYILNSHGFLIQSYEYNIYAAITLFILSKVATMLWNFQDLIVIVVSMALTSRYHKLNMYVHQIVRYENKTRDLKKLGTDVYIQSQVWRRVREAFVRQAALVRQVDLDLGPLILLSNVNNFYFICLQLYMGIGHLRGEFIHTLYFFSSLGWLLFRACSVVLAASDVNIHSKRALATLYKCPGSGYNIEVKRLINQLSNDSVALSGMGLFNLNRQLILQVAAAVLKYELVLLQYDDE